MSVLKWHFLLFASVLGLASPARPQAPVQCGDDQWSILDERYVHELRETVNLLLANDPDRIRKRYESWKTCFELIAYERGRDYMEGRIALAEDDVSRALSFLQNAASDDLARIFPDVFFYHAIARIERALHEEGEDAFRNRNIARNQLERYLRRAAADASFRESAQAMLRQLEIELSPARVEERPGEEETRITSRSETPPGGEEPGEPLPPARSARATIVWVSEVPSEEEPAEEPNFPVLWTRDGEVSLGELPGPVVLMHFWASWCEPCREELPGFLIYVNSLAFSELQGGDLEVVLVTIDTFLSSGETFLQSLRVRTPPLYHDRDYEMLKKTTGRLDIPATVAVRTQDGTVLETFPATDWRSAAVHEELRQILEDTRTTLEGE